MPFFQTAATVHSDHEKRRTLTGIADLDNPSAEALADTLRLAREIRTDHELASVLIRIADRHALRGPLRASYIAAADTITSSFERRQTMAALAGQ